MQTITNGKPLFLIAVFTIPDALVALVGKLPSLTPWLPNLKNCPESGIQLTMKASPLNRFRWGRIRKSGGNARKVQIMSGKPL